MKDLTVMFVDDEQNVLNSLEYNLVRESYKKVFFTRGDKALEYMTKEPVHVLVADIKMPVMDGLSLLKNVREHFPDTVRIVLSGFAEVEQIIASINTGEIFRYVTKPVDEPEKFRGIISDAIEYYLLRRDKDELIASLRQTNNELIEAMARVKKLEGLIPICCYCKKIRNDANYWQRVEEYVEQRSDAVFSHGICPDCIKKYIEPQLSAIGVHLDDAKKTQ
jgi:DNA-binding NtrC family response regulator